MNRRLLTLALSALIVTTASAQTGGAVSVGHVTSIDGGKITLALSDGGTLIFSNSDLAPGATIVLGGQTRQLTDVRVGMKLNVQFGLDLAIHHISDASLSSSPVSKIAGKPPVASSKAAAPTPWNSPSASGKFRWWTGVVSERGTQGTGPAMTMMFVLTQPGTTVKQAFHPDAKTRFYVMSNGKPVLASFTEIVLNGTVSVAVQDGQVTQATVLR